MVALSSVGPRILFLSSQPNGLTILVPGVHGLAYELFMIGGQIFVGKMAPKEIGASAQSLIFIATNGIGLFLGTQLAGIVMEKNSVDGKFQWSKIWAVPLGITVVGAIVLAVLFKVPTPTSSRALPPPEQQVLVDVDHAVPLTSIPGPANRRECDCFSTAIRCILLDVPMGLKLNIPFDVYAILRAVMFLEWAAQGIWMPVLAPRLFGPLKMNGKQTGWIYATFPLACIFAPLASGYLADKWFNAEWSCSLPCCRRSLAFSGGPADEVLGHVLGDAGVFRFVHGHAATGEQDALRATSRRIGGCSFGHPCRGHWLATF